MRANSTWISAVTTMAMVTAAWGASPEYTIQRLQDRLNSHALSSIAGTVDYEYLYAVQASHTVVLLEDPPAAAPALPDTGGGAAGPAPPPASPAFTAVTILDTVRNAQGRDSLVVQRIDTPSSTGRPSLGADGPPERLTSADLPEDLRSVDTAGLRRAMPLAHPGADALYLAVRQVGDDPRYPGERLTLADQQVALAGRRLLRWQLGQLYQRWPSGSVLMLENAAVAAGGARVQVPVRWSYRRPVSDPAAYPAVLASGEFVLELVAVDEGWRVSHAETLVAALQQGAERAHPQE